MQFTFKMAQVLTKPSMKKILFIVFLFLGQMAFSQGDATINSIKIAFKTGNSTALAKYFNTTIDLKILDKEDAYSASQAKLILKDFFSKYPPKSYYIVHEGKSKNAVKYLIGTLTSDAKSFRVYIYLKGESEKLTIQELSIEEEE